MYVRQEKDLTCIFLLYCKCILIHLHVYIECRLKCVEIVTVITLFNIDFGDGPKSTLYRINFLNKGFIHVFKLSYRKILTGKNFTYKVQELLEIEPCTPKIIIEKFIGIST